MIDHWIWNLYIGIVTILDDTGVNIIYISHLGNILLTFLWYFAKASNWRIIYELEGYDKLKVNI